MKKLLVLFMFIITFFVLSACSSERPEGKPVETMERYLQAEIMDADYELAYSLLCEKNKAELSFDEYNYWRNTLAQFLYDRNYEIINNENGEFSNAFLPYDYNFKWIVFLEEQDNTGYDIYEDHERIYYTVSENNEWKVYVHGDLGRLCAIELALIGGCYADGIYFEQDVNKAIEYAQKALGVYPDSLDANLLLAACYFYDGQFNNALEVVDSCIKLTYNTDGYEQHELNIYRSDLYNIQGVAYYNLNELLKSKHAFNESLEYNPENSEAIYNLDTLF